jgi:hypothetical protein
MDTLAVIAGLDPATPIMGQGRAILIGVAGTSLVKPGHDAHVKLNKVH